MKIFADKQIKTLFLQVSLQILVFAFLGTLLIIWDFPHKSILLFFAAIAVLFLVLAELYIYFRRQNTMLENAVDCITEYISGNRKSRIECDEEGEIYKLFHKINSLAAVLNAHADKEAKSKEFLKDTISDISHQLKTPLAALNVYNGIMQEETEDMPQLQDFVKLTEQELDRMETLVRNLLKMAKFDSGTIHMNKKTENVSQIMNDIKDRFLFRLNNEEKTVTLSGNKDIYLCCDRYWLVQGIENIVKNAIDHTDKGGHIDISWKKLPSIVQIIVKDNGKGIHPEDMHYIFKRFYRSRFSQDTQGIGLGLPLSKAVIEAHNGTVQADSILGRGTSFVINFLIPTKL